jgi:hypothetical protein
MSDKTGKIIKIGVVTIFLVLAKFGDNVIRFVDDLSPQTKQTIRVFSNSARILGRQYVNEDNPQNIKGLEDWTEKQYTDYFLTDLSKINKLLPKYYEEINDSNLVDTVYRIRVVRNFEWIYKNSSFDYIIEKLDDSTNVDLKNGANYFLQIAQAKDFHENQDRFQEKFIDFLEKTKKKWGDNFTKDKFRSSLKERTFTLFYPYHDKVFNETMKFYKD